MLTRSLLCCAIVSWTWGTAKAAPPSQPKQDAVDLSDIAKLVAGSEKEESNDDTPFPKFEDVTKGMVKKEGMFTLWHYPASAKDKDQQKLLAEIPDSLLGEKFMLSTSFSGGGFLTGFPLDERVVQWELLDRQLVLVEPETRFVVDDTSTVSHVVKRTYPDRIRVSVPLVTKSSSDAPVIDLGELLKSEFADIGWFSFDGGGSIDRSLSKWTKRKVFPLNIEIGVELAVSRSEPPGAYDKRLIHYSFWKLPASEYQPRVADDRVGYFLTANQDWSKPTDSRDLFNRYIDRWHLEKRDDSLKLCEPKQPIIYYIEKTVPVRFRRAVRDGILEWNKAYEKVGFLNAIEVRQQTDDNEWKNLDPEDMRYSFFRWIVTGMGFAMGPHRANPFTGQIYDADIIFDDSMVRFFEQDMQTMMPAEAMALKMRDPAIEAFLEKFPQWRRPDGELTGVLVGGDEQGKLRRAARQRLRRDGRNLCEYAEGMKHQLAFSRAMLAEAPKELVEKFLYDTVKEVVMHEVGHTLGLRHNFKASSVWTLDEIRQRKTEGKATTGSVMDYNPVLFFKDNPTEGNFLTSTIGPYDYWAVEYGYRPADGTYEGVKSDKKEKAGEKGDSERKEGEKKVAAKTPSEEKTAAAKPEEISKEVLDKLPEEVRKLIAASGAGTAQKSGDEEEDEDSSASFVGPNADEIEMLHDIASRSADPELAFATDEDTTGLGVDPRTNLFDAGRDPVNWAKSRIEIIDKRMDNILDWGVKDKESWYHLRTAFLRLLFEKAFVLDYVGRYIGGELTNRSHRGDPNAQPPFELVDVQTQRDAMAFIEQTLYSDKFFQFSPKVLRHLTVPRWWHDGAYVSYRVDFPIHDLIGMLQWWNLFDRLYPDTLRRIHDAELKADGKERFTVAEYIRTMQSACWGESMSLDRAKEDKWTDEAPFISDIRRSLQRQYLILVEPLVRTPPGQVLSPDLHAMVQASIRGLQADLEKVAEIESLDFASKAHIQACQSRIKRILAPNLQEFDVMFLGME